MCRIFVPGDLVYPDSDGVRLSAEAEVAPDKNQWRADKEPQEQERDEGRDRHGCRRPSRPYLSYCEMYEGERIVNCWGGGGSAEIYYDIMTRLSRRAETKTYR